MKICHLTSAHNNNDTRIFYKECVSLAKKYDVYMVARGGSREEKGVHVIGVGEAPDNRLKRAISFADKVVSKGIEIDADVYHLHDPELLRFVDRLKKKGKIVIFDSHEDTLHQMREKTYIPKTFRGLFADSYTKYATRIFSKCDFLVTVTPTVYEDLKNINPHTFMVTNYPFIPEVTDYPDDRHRKIDNHKLKLCFTGGLTKQWNHERFSRVIRSIPECEYVLCGKTDEEYIEYLNELSGGKVRYLGKVSPPEAVSVQKQCDVGIALLLPSLNSVGMTGTLGNTKMFEYMSSGIPVICTKFDLWKDIIDKYDCGICVDPYSDKEIRDAVKTLKNNPEKRLRMGKNGVKAVLQEYNWNTQEKELFNLYEMAEKQI